jgi:hypothetical protein
MASSTPSHASNIPASSSPSHASSTPASSSPSHASSTPASSSPINHSVSSQTSHDTHSVSSASSEIYSLSSIPHVSPSATYVSPSSHAVYASSEAYSVSSAPYSSYYGGAYPYSSSSAASIHYDAYSSAPASYPISAYSGYASAPAYGDKPPTSTPCTTPSVAAYVVPTYPVYPAEVSSHGQNPSYPMGGPVKQKYPNSAPGYDSSPSHANSALAYDSYTKSAPSYDTYPASSPVKNDYPYLPSFTPVTPIYPPTTSAPSYNDYPVSKTTITTTYTTTYIDVCPTGYTTYGWDVTTKVCDKGCGENKKTVTLTVPCTSCNYATPVPKKPVCNGYDCVKDVTSKVYETKIITVTVPARPKSDVPKQSYSVPVYSASKPIYDASKSKPVYGASKPVYEAPKSVPVVPGKPASPTPAMWVGGNKGNGTMGSGTGAHAAPSKTGYYPPIFTGAASGLQVSSIFAVVSVIAAMAL